MFDCGPNSGSVKESIGVEDKVCDIVIMVSSVTDILSDLRLTHMLSRLCSIHMVGDEHLQ